MDIETLRARLLEINNSANELRAKASGEHRDLTVEEEGELNDLLAEYERVENRINQLSKLEDQTAKLNTPKGRKTQAEDPARLSVDDNGDVAVSRPTQGDMDRRRIPATPLRPMERNGGFQTLGHFAMSVKSASHRGGTVDPRLERLAPTTTGNEGSGADGGFMVPPDFRNVIMEKVLGGDSLISRCDQVTVQGNSFTCPTDETTPWQTTGGIQAYWGGEGSSTTQTKPKLGETTIKLNKLTALVPMTEELLEDAPATDAYLRRKAPAKMRFALDLALLQGTGAGQPMGVLRSPALKSVAKESGQQADTIVAMNVIKMYSAMPAENRANAVFMINPDIEPQLYKLSIPGTDNTGNFVTGWGGLLYMPANGLSQSPYGTLFGRPVIPHQACETLGDQGDILFVDFSQYLALLKSGPNPRVDVSMHLWFDTGHTAYRFGLRVGGQPWWGSSISARDGSATYSPFVTLDERS